MRELASSKGNPIPKGAVCGEVFTPDALAIRYARWKARRAPYKGTIILLQGRSEYIEKHFETVEDLVKNGFDVCTFDFRGQGGSGRILRDKKRGYIDSFDQYVIDLDTVLNEVALPDCRPPYYILGHSTGSLIALIASPILGNRIQRMVLCAPLIRFGTVPTGQQMTKYLSGLLSVTGLGEMYLSGGPNLTGKRKFMGNHLTSDTKRFERTREFSRQHPELVIGGPTAAWVFAACQAMDRVSDPDFIRELHIPTLLVSGALDKVVSIEATELLGRAMRSGRAVTINGARHELLQERDVYRQQLLAALFAFIPGSQS
ncbi:MAG: alpha/beta fold hydrolase [Rhizobiaceae bacterium]